MNKGKKIGKKKNSDEKRQEEIAKFTRDFINRYRSALEELAKK